MKTATKYDFFVEEYGARHELTLQAKEKHKQAYKNVLEGRQEYHIDALCSNPELRVIITREQLMELLSSANVEKARNGRFDDELLENALAAMKIAKETGGPAARTPKKPVKTGPRCQFCDKEVPLKRLWCSICKQAFLLRQGVPGQGREEAQEDLQAPRGCQVKHFPGLPFGGR